MLLPQPPPPWPGSQVHNDKTFIFFSSFCCKDFKQTGSFAEIHTRSLLKLGLSTVLLNSLLSCDVSSLLLNRLLSAYQPQVQTKEEDGIIIFSNPGWLFQLISHGTILLPGHINHWNSINICKCDKGSRDIGLLVCSLEHREPGGDACEFLS